MRVGLITLGILVVPLVLQLTIGTGIDGQGWNWKFFDFVFAGVLVFIAGLAIDWAVRNTSKYRILAIAIIILLFLWVWAEFAVGVFTNLGS